MAVVMERSPKVFSNMDEETIRTHFLVQLNGHYQGQATGETFNSNGKTDILIRNDNQNVFIAECKFWKGKKGYLSTIEQLLGYVTYRDTKTAIFMFVKIADQTRATFSGFQSPPIISGERFSTTVVVSIRSSLANSAGFVETIQSGAETSTGRSRASRK